MSEAKSDDILHIPVSEYDHIRGQTDAPLTLLEYGDYECPDCEHAAPIVIKLRKEFGDRLRFVFRHFPNSAIHTHASESAQAAEAAGAQGKFWEMHDVLYKHQKDLADHDIAHFGLLVGAEVYRLQADLSASRYAGRVAQDYDSGVKNGVKGTPTFFINGKRYHGPVTFEALQAALEKAAR
jgi:formate-nitrite transporter family protein